MTFGETGCRPRISKIGLWVFSAVLVMVTWPIGLCGGNGTLEQVLVIEYKNACFLIVFIVKMVS